MADEQVEQAEQVEPGEVTSRFRAFSQSVDPEPSKALPTALIAVGALIVIVLVAVVWIMLAR